MLPSYGVEVVEIPRLAAPVLSDDPVILSEAGGEVEESITASRVRAFLDEGRFRAASALTPSSTWPYLLAFLAERALRMELDAPLKPGLVCPDSSGAHRDMDYNLMRRGIAAIRPFFPRMAQAASPEGLRQLGIDAEQAMLAATGGVNTHRGAIFALGLALSAAARCAADRDLESADYQRAMHVALREITQSIFGISLTDRELQSTPQSHGAAVVGQYGVKGAREMALGGYEDLFRSWLPYYSAVKMQPYALQRTLLFLIASLDDTCMIHRVGYERAREVKREVAALLGEIPGQAGNDAGMAGWAGRLQTMCERFAAEGVSPGGAADMLALTIFADSLLN
jgi:triphosphoribosyl-dephospho-CoA synthase